MTQKRVLIPWGDLIFMVFLSVFQLFIILVFWWLTLFPPLTFVEALDPYGVRTLAFRVGLLYLAILCLEEASYNRILGDFRTEGVRAFGRVWFVLAALMILLMSQRA